MANLNVARILSDAQNTDSEASADAKQILTAYGVTDAEIASYGVDPTSDAALTDKILQAYAASNAETPKTAPSKPFEELPAFDSSKPFEDYQEPKTNSAGKKEPLPTDLTGWVEKKPDLIASVIVIISTAVAAWLVHKIGMLLVGIVDDFGWRETHFRKLVMLLVQLVIVTVLVFGIILALIAFHKLLQQI